MIKLKHIYKSYTLGEIDVPVLLDVNLHVKPHEFVSILGPSGSGKSTLMNIIGCLDIPDSGDYILDGEYVDNCTEDQLSEIRGIKIGFIFQQFNLLPDLTAYENVALMRELEEDTMDPLEALGAVGLSEHIHQFPSQMSGGEQQRTSIARALAKKPKLLLCDEPTGALDTETGREVLKLLIWMSRVKKRTVVMVTHNSSFAGIADKVIRVRNGQIQEIIVNAEPKSADEVSW